MRPSPDHNPMAPEFDQFIHMYILGEPASGRSSLFLKYLHNKCPEDYGSLHGEKQIWGSKIIKFSNSNIKITLYDFYESRFATLEGNRFRHMNVNILCFDLASNCRCKDFSEIMPLYLREIARKGNESSTTIVAGCKADIPGAEVISDQLQSFCKQKNLEYVPVSAKTGYNVDYLFTRAIELHQQYLQNKAEQERREKEQAQAHHTARRRKLIYPKTSDILQSLKKSIQPKQPAKATLVNMLKAYIDRIEKADFHYTDSAKTIDFAIGFYFDKKARSQSRYLNYQLANKLYTELQQPGTTVNTVFANVSDYRQSLVGEVDSNPKLKGFKDRGINSRELNTVIRKGKNQYNLSYPTRVAVASCLTSSVAVALLYTGAISTAAGPYVWPASIALLALGGVLFAGVAAVKVSHTNCFNFAKSHGSCAESVEDLVPNLKQGGC